MTGSRIFRLRVAYQLKGRLSLLSHLEVTHALERAIRRSGLPFALTCGFSPHMKLSFGSALPVGIGSECEVFDLSLTDYVAPARVLERLQDALPEDMRPLACEYLEENAPKASCAYPLSTYEVKLSEALPALPVPRTITVMRKKKERELVIADFLQGEVKCDGDAVRFTLVSKDTGSVRADAFVGACLEELRTQGKTPPRVMSITRVALES